MSYSGYGELFVYPISAKLKRDTEVIGKMDPYCKFTCGPNKQCSGIHTNGGKFPQWKDKLLFRLRDEKQMNVEVWDSDTMSKDDLVGSATIFLDEACKQGSSQKWYTLSYKGKDAGSVLVKLEFTQSHQPNPPTAMHQNNPNTIPMRMSMGNNNPPQGYNPQYYPPPQQPGPGQYPPPQQYSYPPQGQYGNNYQCKEFYV